MSALQEVREANERQPHCAWMTALDASLVYDGLHTNGLCEGTTRLLDAERTMDMDVDTIVMWERVLAEWEREHTRAAEAHARRFRKAAKSHQNLTPEQRKRKLRAAYLVIVQAKMRARRKRAEWAQRTEPYEHMWRWRLHLRRCGK